MTTADNGWSYVSADNRKLGPLPKEHLLALIAQGRLRGDTLVWREGFDAWRKACEVEELGVAPPAAKAAASAATANLLTQKLAPTGAGLPVPAAAPAVAPRTQLLLKIAGAVVLLVCVGWANWVYRFVGPKPGSEYGTKLPDRWFSADNKEGVIIQSEFYKRACGGGKGGFRVTAVVSAGRAQNNRLPVDKSSNLCNVTIRNTEGEVVFNQDITTKKLCPT